MGILERVFGVGWVLIELDGEGSKFIRCVVGGYRAHGALSLSELEELCKGIDGS